MANVLTRRFLIRNILKLNQFSNLAAYSCTNVFFTQLNNGGTSNFKNKYKNKFAVLHLPKNSDVVCYSNCTKKDGEKDSKTGLEEKEEKLSLLQKFKIMYRDYWYVLVPVHILTSTVWFGAFYYMAKSGIDIIQILESLHVSERVINPLRDSSMGYFAVAYALYKISTPARYTVTLGGTTLSINYLKKWGYIKPVPSKERMKEIYEEKRENLTKSMKHTKEGIMETKSNIIESVRDTKEGIIEKKRNIIESLHETKEDITEKKDKLVESVKETTENLKKHKESIKNKVSKLKDKTETEA